MKPFTAALLALVLTSWSGNGFAQNKPVRLSGPSEFMTPEDNKAVKDLQDSMLELETRAQRLETRGKAQTGKAAFWNRWRAQSVGMRLKHVRDKLYRVTKKRDDVLLKEITELQASIQEIRKLLVIFQDQSRAQEPDVEGEAQFARAIDIWQTRVDEVMKIILRK